MNSFHIIDAPLKRVKYFNPDLDIDILLLDDQKILRDGLKAELAHTRSALVARVADIVNQNARQESALDAAVAMVEVLINSYNGYGERPGNGHKHALQAIGLLASSSQRFDVAIDFFFDMVDRFCARSHAQGTNRPCTDAFVMRMMQNYDQTFVKVFLSKHWSSSDHRDGFNLEMPLERIKTLRRDYESRDNWIRSCIKNFGANRAAAPMFSDSVKVLRSLQKRRATENIKTSISNRATRRYSLASFSQYAYRKSKDTATTISDSSASHHGDYDIPVVYEAMMIGTHAKPGTSHRKERTTSFFAVVEDPVRTSWYDSSTSLNTRIDQTPIPASYHVAAYG